MRWRLGGIGWNGAGWRWAGLGSDRNGWILPASPWASGGAGVRALVPLSHYIDFLKSRISGIRLACPAARTLPLGFSSPPPPPLGVKCYCSVAFGLHVFEL